MPSDFPFEIVIFAAIAAVVLFQLYNVLGKKVGRQPEDGAKAPPAVGLAAAAAAPAGPEVSANPAVEAAAADLKARDPAFEPMKFLEGARQAYETIVTAYAAADREALRPLLSPKVMTSFEAGLNARGVERAETVEFAHPPRADLEHAGAEGDVAWAKVRFLAELRSRIVEADGDEIIEERRTAELWTFERHIGAPDPNWVLARVEPAAA